MHEDIAKEDEKNVEGVSIACQRGEMSNERFKSRSNKPVVGCSRLCVCVGSECEHVLESKTFASTLWVIAHRREIGRNGISMLKWDDLDMDMFA